MLALNSLFLLRFIHWESNNIQHSMLSNPENNNISIHNYYKEIFPTFMLALWLFIIRLLTVVYLKLI